MTMVNRLRLRNLAFRISTTKYLLETCSNSGKENPIFGHVITATLSVASRIKPFGVVTQAVRGSTPSILRWLVLGLGEEYIE